MTKTFKLATSLIYFKHTFAILGSLEPGIHSIYPFRELQWDEVFWDSSIVSWVYTGTHKNCFTILAMLHINHPSCQASQRNRRGERERKKDRNEGWGGNGKVGKMKKKSNSKQMVVLLHWNEERERGAFISVAKIHHFFLCCFVWGFLGGGLFAFFLFVLFMTYSTNWKRMQLKMKPPFAGLQSIYIQ